MDRKALIRAYKETRRPMGVYRIRNLRSGRWSLGTSTDLPSILNRNRAQLKLGAHGNRALQADWNEQGPDAFTFEVLDTLKPPETEAGYDPVRDLKILEEMWRERLGRESDQSYDRK